MPDGDSDLYFRQQPVGEMANLAANPAIARNS